LLDSLLAGGLRQNRALQLWSAARWQWSNSGRRWMISSSVKWWTILLLHEREHLAVSNIDTLIRWSLHPQVRAMYRKDQRRHPLRALVYQKTAEDGGLWKYTVSEHHKRCIPALKSTMSDQLQAPLRQWVGCIIFFAWKCVSPLLMSLQERHGIRTGWIMQSHAFWLNS